MICFSKRKSGLMKKAYELSALTGTQVMLLVASETGHVYTFATKKLKPIITSDAGKTLIQTCLNTPDDDEEEDEERGKSAEKADVEGTNLPPFFNLLPPTLSSVRTEHPIDYVYMCRRLFSDVSTRHGSFKPQVSFQQ